MAFSSHDPPRWYALYTRPGDEVRVCGNLHGLQLETLNPQVRGRSIRTHDGRRSLFPRYVFARFGRAAIRHVRFARGVVDIVSTAGKPAAIDEPVIETIRRRMDEHGFVRLDPALAPGDRVIITSGVFEGIQGVFQHALKEQQRVAILLTLLHGTVRLTVPIGLLRKANG